MLVWMSCSLSSVTYPIWWTNITLFLKPLFKKRVYTCFPIQFQNYYEVFQIEYKLYIPLCQYIMQTLIVKFAVSLTVIWWSIQMKQRSFSSDTVLVSIIVHMRPLWWGINNIPNCMNYKMLSLLFSVNNSRSTKLVYSYCWFGKLK